MLSLMIYQGGQIGTQNLAQTKRVVRTIAALVPHLVQGGLTNVALAGPESPTLEAIASEAGCRFSPVVGLNAAYNSANTHFRSPWRGVLLAGHAPSSGFFEEIEDMIQLGEVAGGVAYPEAQQLLSLWKSPCLLLWRGTPATDTSAKTLKKLSGELNIRHTLRSRLRVVV